MSEEVEEAIKLFDREDLLSEYGIQDTDTNIEVFMSIKDMVKYYRQDLEIERLNKENEYLNKVNIELSTLNTSLRSDRDNYKSIIKEVREYINKIPTQPVIRVFKKELLEILGGENNDK